MRQESDVEQTIERYGDMVKHICVVYMKNESDTEDVFQDVFLKYALFSEPFLSEEHRKAWLIRVTVNRCKDVLRSFFRRHTCSLEEAAFETDPGGEEHSDVLEAVLKLHDRYRILIYLHYYQGYSAVEIAEVLHKKINTVYTQLARARAELKKMLGGDEDESGDTECI